MQKDSAHRLSQSEVSLQVMVQDMTVKRIGFLTLDIFILSQKTKISVLEAEWAGRANLVLSGFGQCLTGQNRTKTG